MATNITYEPGDQVSLPVAAGTKSGDPVRVGGLNGVAITDRAVVTGQDPFNTNGTLNAAYNWGGGNPDGSATVLLEGAPTLEVTSTGISAGDAIYFDAAATPKLTTTQSGTLPVFGYALAAGVPANTGTQSTPVRLFN